MVRFIHSLNTSTLYALEFSLNENWIELLGIPEKIGFSHATYPEFNQRLTTVIPNPSYVGVALNSFCEAIQIQPSLMDNTNLLSVVEGGQSSSFIYSHRIAIAIGAANLERMMRVSNLCDIFLQIEKTFPNFELVLIGTGSKEEKYAQEIINNYSGKTLINKVSMLNLFETIEFINHSRLLIGFDSGLYNLAFTLKKPTLCLAATNEKVLHSAPWVRIVRGNGQTWGQADRYGCTKTNSIVADEVCTCFAELLAVDEQQISKSNADLSR